MGFAPAGQSIRLSDLADQLIAIRYLGRDNTVQTKYGTQTAPLARVVQLGDDPKILGTTLVFQVGVANEIKNQVGNWVVGVLRHEQHPDKEDQTLYSIDPEGVDMEAALAAFRSTGLDPDAAV